jgi:hypothetical protein
MRNSLLNAMFCKILITVYRIVNRRATAGSATRAAGSIPSAL